MTMPTGAQISGYTIERTLGAGGMGTVYLAKHPTLPRSVALKVLSAELSADPEFQARFRREADLAASLDHPNIVRVYTRGQADDGRLWIAMQFIDGTDAGVLADQGPLPVERTLHIIGEVAKALDFAHSRKLLHRDIKPANFLLAGEPGPQERVLLADFGIARALEEATRLTATGSMMATVAYASPEAIEGQSLDHRSDLYSLGCALYRLLTGRTPFQDAGTMSAVMMAHLTRPVPSVTEFAPQLPPAIDTVLAVAMAKSPAQRFESARELYEAASTALLHNQVPARPSPEPVTVEIPGGDGATLPYPGGPNTGALARLTQIRKSPQRNRLLGGAAAVGAAVLVAALIAANYGSDKPAYPLQSFNHTFGTTEIPSRPTAVATLTLADADVAVALGVQPIALATPGGGEPPHWLADRMHGHPRLLPGPDAESVKAANPDLVIDTGAIDKKQYDALAAIAPTITCPASTGKAITTDTRLTWIADVLGERDSGTRVRDNLKSSFDAIHEKYRSFAGVEITVFKFSDDGISALRSNSPQANYFTSLGFNYNGKLQGGSDAATEKPIRTEDIYGLKTPVGVVLRTDKAAGSGGYYRLPSALIRFRGQLVVLDDADTLAALQSGGPLASKYLNESLAPAIAKELG